MSHNRFNPTVRRPMVPLRVSVGTTTQAVRWTPLQPDITTLLSPLLVALRLAAAAPDQGIAT